MSVNYIHGWFVLDAGIWEVDTQTTNPLTSFDDEVVYIPNLDNISIVIA